MRNLNFSAFLSRLIMVGFLGFTAVAPAQSSLTNVAGEYAVIASLPGDQMASHTAINSAGGWVVWQDNITDEEGYGISARHLGAALSGDLNVFRVNQVGAGDQENPRVVMLKDGGAAFVWQGGKFGFQKIYARLMSSAGVFAGGDILVNSYTNQQQVLPSVACLQNGNVVVTWSSYGQDGSLYGIYGRVIAPNGTFVSSEFRINQVVDLNQRSVSVTALANGNFVVTWASERSLGAAVNADNPGLTHAAEIYGRIFSSQGNAVSDEFLVSAEGKIAASPSACGVSGGGFLVGWSQKDFVNTSNSWDVFVRSFNSEGAATQSGQLINSHLLGDQYGPALATSGTTCFVTWTSLGQDGSAEGVYGRLLADNAGVLSDEIQVNTSVSGRQFQQALASDAAGRFLVTWSSFIGGSASFDLFAQRFSVGSLGLVAPEAPYVSALSATSLSVTWPTLDGYSVAFYELYMDGNPTPLVVNGNQKTILNLSPSSTHTFKLLYQLSDGQRSPLSASSVGHTWGVDNNSDGLPDDWQATYWGGNPTNWPTPTTVLSVDCGSVLQAFLAGTDPLDCSTALKSFLTLNSQGMTFSWNTQPGFIYQVQVSADLINWQDQGVTRFARSSSDSISIPGSGVPNFYRVVRLR